MTVQLIEFLPRLYDTFSLTALFSLKKVHWFLSFINDFIPPYYPLHQCTPSHDLCIPKESSGETLLSTDLEKMVAEDEVGGTECQEALRMCNMRAVI